MDAITRGVRPRLAAEVSEAVEAALSASCRCPRQAAAAMPRRATRGIAACSRASRGAAAPLRRRQVGPRLGPAQIAECERRAGAATDALQRLALSHARARAVGAVRHARPRLGHAGAHRVAGDGSGLQRLRQRCDRPSASSPLLQARGAAEGYRLLPRQERPVVINTKGPSASGKSTLRPLQKKLAGEIGVQLERFRADQPGHLAQAAARLRLARRRLQVRRRLHRRGAADRRSEARPLHGAQVRAAATCRTC